MIPTLMPSLMAAIARRRGLGGVPAVAPSGGGPYEYLRPLNTLPKNYDGTPAIYDSFTGNVIVDNVDTRYDEHEPATVVALTDTANTATNATNLIAAIATACASATSTKITLPIGFICDGVGTIPAYTNSDSKHVWIEVEDYADNFTAGTRALAVDISVSAIIRAKTTAGAFALRPDVHNFQLNGIYLDYNTSSVTTANGYVYGLIPWYNADGPPSDATDYPTGFVLRHCYLTSHDNMSSIRIVGAYTTQSGAIDTTIVNHGLAGTGDCQCWLYLDGPGVMKFDNVHMQNAFGESFMVGGGSHGIDDYQARNFLFRRCLFDFPIAWHATRFTKNLFELKHGQDILLIGCVFSNFHGVAEYNQRSAVAMKTVDQTASNQWYTDATIVNPSPHFHTNNVTMLHCELVNCSGGIGITGLDDHAGNANLMTSDIELLNVGMRKPTTDYEAATLHGTYYAGAPLALGPPHYNTGEKMGRVRIQNFASQVRTSGSGVRTYNQIGIGNNQLNTSNAAHEDALTNLTVKDAVFASGLEIASYWMWQDSATEMTAWNYLKGDAVMAGCAMAAKAPSTVPAGNTPVATVAALKLNADLSLESDSPAKGIGDSGRDSGIDRELLDTFITGVV